MDSVSLSSGGCIDSLVHLQGPKPAPPPHVPGPPLPDPRPSPPPGAPYTSGRYVTLILHGVPRPRSGLSQDFRFGSSDGTSLHPHPAKRNHFFTRKRAAAEAAPIEPPSCPSWGLIRRCEGNFADTPPSFRPQYSDFACAKCGATRPAQATPRSGPACHRIACG